MTLEAFKTIFSQGSGHFSIFVPVASSIGHGTSYLSLVQVAGNTDSGISLYASHFILVLSFFFSSKDFIYF